MNIHTEERPYQCDQCKKKLSTRCRCAHVRRHKKMRHTNSDNVLQNGALLPIEFEDINPKNPNQPKKASALLSIKKGILPAMKDY